MAPEELDKVMSKFYTEVKKKDGDDYQPKPLKIMQSAIERYLKKKGYPVSIVRSREFHNSQEILNAKAISLRQHGRGKRPNKSQPVTPDEESALWEKDRLGDFNGWFTRSPGALRRLRRGPCPEATGRRERGGRVP